MKKPHIIILAAAILVVGGIYVWRTTSSNNPSPISNPQSPILTPAVAALLTKESMSLADRLNLLPALGNGLPAADRMALLDSIQNTAPNGLTADDWHSLANDILQTLRNQQPYTPEYTDRLVALWHDKTLDPTLRDYALQQLREWVADGDSRTVHEERPKKIALIRQTFLDAVTPDHPDCDIQSTTTGTALLALDEWAYSSSPNLKSQISNLLLSHSGEPSAHRGVRATSLQLCARRGIKESLPIARSILADTSSDAILRMSAISLLGTLGTADDFALLTDFQRANTRDPMLQSSLQKALKNLSANPSPH